MKINNEESVMGLRVIENLGEVLEKHRKWLKSEDGGERANLRSADLRHADLSSADLRHADLRSADLRHAGLRSAVLRHADLRHADLRSADLSSADLRHADLPEETWVIFGETYFISIHCGILRAGCQELDIKEWRCLSESKIKGMDGERAVNFYPRLIEIIDFYCGKDNKS